MGRLKVLIMALAVVFSGCSFKSTEPPNTLHVYVSAKLKGLDPIYTDDLYSGIQTSQPYETLLQYNYLKRPLELEPLLAESMPVLSEGGKKIVFRLKKGVFFQDNPCFKETKGKGREMRAEDFVYSFKRLADPALASPGWWVFEDKVVGLNAWRELALKSGKADYTAPVEGIKAPDPYTLEIHLTRPAYQLLYSLTMVYTAVVPHEAVEFYGKEFLNHPVGTGPWQLAEFNPSSRIIWKRNPTYRKEVYPSVGESGDKEAGLLEDAGKALPLADQVNVQIITETQPQWLNFVAGKLDALSIPKDNFSTVINEKRELRPEFKEKGIQLRVTPLYDTTHATFNMVDPIIGKNKYLRQAISLAYDQETFNDLFYNGRAILAEGPIPPGLSGYSAELKNPYRRFNVSKAKELMAKAGYPEGKGLPPLEYATLADSFYRQTAEYFQKLMEPLGIKVNVTAYSWPQFLEAMKNKKAQIWEFAWGADYPDGENFLQLFYSKNFSPGPNDGNYSNPDFDRMYEHSLTLPDSPERTALYRKMVDLLVEDCPWIFEAHRIGFFLSQPWFKNYKPSDLDHRTYKYYRIDTALKK
ncbi:MAG: ABC transporter substrate-binding protein [Bdellovibrio sp.]|nr:ABC transporter substrate-binding protein [Bdellovibrio sp.]